MSQNKIEIRKIFLPGFIAILVDLYNNGLDYINMVVEKGENQDAIWIMDSVDDAPITEIKKDVNFEDLI